METEEVKEETTEEVKEGDDISSIFTDIKDLITAQHKEIESLKSEIKTLKEGEKDEKKEEEKTAFDEFKEDIKRMLQGYNRNNPGDTEKNVDFEKSQMDLLNRRF